MIGEDNLTKNNSPKNGLIELVFFDTFSHDNDTDINLDFVQFRNPVCIQEIRIIPLGAKVEADFPGGVRLGATNPSAFEVLFYVNDLRKKSLCTFTKFGNFDYKQNVNIKFVPEEKIIVNSLVLKGKYTTLTLAIFAEIIDENSIVDNEATVQESVMEIEEDVNNIESQDLKYVPQNIVEEQVECIVEDFCRSGNNGYINNENTDTECKTQEEFNKNVNDNVTSSETKEEEVISPPRILASPLSPQENIEQIKSPIDDLECPSEMEVSELTTNIEESFNHEENDNNFDLEPISPEQLLLADLTENVSDDDMIDCNNDDFDDYQSPSLENSAIQSGVITADVSSNNILIGSDDSLSPEDLEAISSEEEYFDETSNNEEIIVDYSDDELNNLKYIEAFDPFELNCLSLSSIKSPIISNYEYKNQNLNIKNSTKKETIEKLIYEFENENCKDEKWVEFIENLTNDLAFVSLGDEQLLDILINWAVVGVDFDIAIKQKKTAFKVRHLKAGIKYVGSLVKTNQEVVSKLISKNILRTLLNLLSKPYMTLPIKLLIIRTIDLFADEPIALKHFFNYKYQDYSNEKNTECTFYQLLLKTLMTVCQTRLITSLTILLKKVHFYDILLKFQNIYTNSLNIDNNEELVLTLTEIIYIFKNTNLLISQKLRFLPASSQFSIKENGNNTYCSIYKWFNHINILSIFQESLAISSDKKLVSLILCLLKEIINQDEGLLFLLSENSVNYSIHLARALLKTEKNEEHENDLYDEKVKLGYKLSFSLHILHLINQIHEIQQEQMFLRKKNFDDPILCMLYFKLYSILYDNIGKIELVNVFCKSTNLDILVQLVLLALEQDKNHKVSKFMSFNYASALLMYVIQFSKEMFCDIVNKYELDLIEISNYPPTSRLNSLSKWLLPFKKGLKFVYNENTFKLLVSILKHHSERLKDVKENCTYQIPPDLISCAQILNYLCVDKTDDLNVHHNFLQPNQLKYKYGLTQLFTQDGVSLILALVQKISEIFLNPSHQKVSLIGIQGYFVISLFEPFILILKRIIQYLTFSRGNEFKDTSPIKTLLKIYSLMLIFPSDSIYYENAKNINSDVIDILLTYTQLTLNLSDVEDEVFNKSVWTKMLQEIIQYTMQKPFYFIHGLNLLSELLPEPFVQSELNSAAESSRLLNFRKLWSAHIHVLSSELEDLLLKLIYCSSILVQILLRKVCYQLVDLSSHSGVIVCKCILAVLEQTLMNYESNEIDDSLCSVFNLINHMLNYPLFKAAFTCTLKTLNTTTKKEEKYESSINKAIEILKNNQEKTQNFSNVLNVLESMSKTNENPSELDLNPIDSLSLQYSNRILHSGDNLLENLENLDSLNQLNLKKIDFKDLASKYFPPEFNLRNTLTEIYKNEEPNYEDKFKITNKQHEPLITKDYSGSVKRPFVAPLRGRGYQRSNVLGSRLNDPFRSRPPNTSRPPSMHVDDFVAMEQNTQNNVKRQKQDFSKYKIVPGQRTNTRTQYFNVNYRVTNTRMSNLNGRNTFNKYGTIQTNYVNYNINPNANNVTNNRTLLNVSRNNVMHMQNWNKQGQNINNQCLLNHPRVDQKQNRTIFQR